LDKFLVKTNKEGVLKMRKFNGVLVLVLALFLVVGISSMVVANGNKCCDWGDIASIYQNGIYNDATIVQTGLGYRKDKDLCIGGVCPGGNMAFVGQFGKGHDALITQIGGDNFASVLSFGRGQDVVIYQEGRRQAALVMQGGHGNEATVRQLGANNFASVKQCGYKNDALVRQLGNYDMAFVTQHGKMNDATIIQH
jgi:minor curlin subunit